MKQLQEQIETAMLMSRDWRAAMSKMDGGSYCEQASRDFKDAMAIRDLYEQLTDALIKFERQYGGDE